MKIDIVRYGIVIKTYHHDCQFSKSKIS